MIIGAKYCEAVCCKSAPQIVSNVLPKPKKGDTENNKKLLVRMTRLFQAIKEPKETLSNLLRDKYYIALICEVCRSPPESQNLWYEVCKPREVVGKILPLAQAGLTIACALNKVSAISRLFGIPTPVLEDSSFEEAGDLLDKLGHDSLADFSELEKAVADQYGPASTLIVGATECTRMGSMGYCVREFERFLSTVDPKNEWANLSPRITESGEICFVCPECCTK